MPGVGGLKSIPRIIAPPRGARGHDRLLARRGGRRGNRRGAGARRRRHAAQARHRPLQRPLLGNPARASSRRWAMPTALDDRASAAAVAADRRRRCARCRPIRSRCSRSARRPAASMRSASCSSALPQRIGVPILVTQHLPAPFMTVFARQLGDGRPARGAGRRGRHGAAARPHHHRARRCASDGRSRPATRRSCG